MSATSRLQRKRNELQEQYDLLSEKTRRLRADYAIETGTAVRFQLEKQIEHAEAERDSVEQQIEAIEGNLEQQTLAGTNQCNHTDEEPTRQDPRTVERTGVTAEVALKIESKKLLRNYDFFTLDDLAILVNELSYSIDNWAISGQTSRVSLVDQFVNQVWADGKAGELVQAIKRQKPHLSDQFDDFPASMIKQSETNRGKVKQQAELGSNLGQPTSDRTEETQLPVRMPRRYSCTVMIVAIIGAIATIVAAVIGVWPFDKTTPTLPPTTTSVAPPGVRLRSIEDGDLIIGKVDSAHGTYDQVPEDKEIWIVAWRGSTCYPMDGPAIREPTGVWRHGPLEFPDTGQYNLSIVLADTSASALLRSAVGHKTGLPCLPDGAEFITTISVEVR